MSDSMKYTAVQMDGIRDVINTGLIAAADMLQKLLSQETSMSADKVQLEEIDNLEVFGLIPALSAKVSYSGAVEGKCVIIIRQADVKHMLNLLMNIEDETTDTDDELSLDEITFNTVRELLNQMTNAYSVTLTEFFGEEIQVTTQDIDIFENMTAIEQYFGCNASCEAVNLTCRLGIKDIMSSCLCIVLENALSDRLVEHVSGVAAPAEQPAAAPAPKPAAKEEAPPKPPVTHEEPPEILHPTGGQMAADPEIQTGRSGPMAPPPEFAQPEDNTHRMQNVRFPDFGEQVGGGGIPLTHGNMDLLMDVPLNVTVEIGKTRKKMREIMEFSQGTIIGLEKQAGAPVDIVVNGQLIARGDVVVIDDNFGVRITEIVGVKEAAEKDA